MLSLRKIYETPEYSVPYNLLYVSEADLLVLNLLPGTWGEKSLFLIEEHSGVLRHQLFHPNEVLGVTPDLKLYSIRRRVFIPSRGRWLEDDEVHEILLQHRGQFAEWPECKGANFLAITNLRELQEITRIPLERLSLGYGEALLASSTGRLYIAFNGDEYQDGYEGLGIVELHQSQFTRIDIGGKPHVLALTPDESLLLIASYSLRTKELVFFKTDSATISDRLSLPFSPQGIMVIGPYAYLLEFLKGIAVLDLGTKTLVDEMPLPGIREFCMGRAADELLLLVASEMTSPADRIVLYQPSRKTVLAQREITEGMKLRRSRDGRFFMTTKNTMEWKLRISEVVITLYNHPVAWLRLR
jgi:hypothetical protein